MSAEPRRCVAPLDDEGVRLCGADAPEERTVEGLVMPLCAEHARELDEERAQEEETTEPPGSVRDAILRVLAAGPSFGLEIIERVKTITNGVLVLGQGSVYPALRTLEDEGLLESYEGEPLPERGGRPRRYYRLATRAAETTYCPTFSLREDLDEGDARWLGEQQGDPGWRLSDVTDACARYRVSAELRDEHGSLKGRVDANGDYRLGGP